jgi:hypothetical protein
MRSSQKYSAVISCKKGDRGNPHLLIIKSRMSWKLFAGACKAPLPIQSPQFIDSLEPRQNTCSGTTVVSTAAQDADPS